MHAGAVPRGGGRRVRASERPCEFLARHLALLPRGRALDVAAGDGRNALFLARNGFSVEAIDLLFDGLREAARTARSEGLPVALVQADLTRFRLAPARYDAGINVRYLQRGLVPQLKSALRPGGRILFETYLREQATIGRPKRLDYLLRRGELLDLFRDLIVLKYREGKFAERGRPAYLASLIAERR